MAKMTRKEAQRRVAAALLRIIEQDADGDSPCAAAAEMSGVPIGHVREFVRAWRPHGIQLSIPEELIYTSDGKEFLEALATFELEDDEPEGGSQVVVHGNVSNSQIAGRDLSITYRVVLEQLLDDVESSDTMDDAEKESVKAKILELLNMPITNTVLQFVPALVGG